MPSHASRRIALFAAAVATTAAGAPAAHAQVVYSGPLNLAIPRSITGLFVNVVNGTTYSGPGTFPVCPGPGCNYDFNIFGTTTRSFFAPGSAGVDPAPETAAERGYVSATSTGNPLALAFGTIIGSTSTFNGDAQVSSAAAFEGALGLVFGFRFRNEAGGANTVHYGWARISLPNAGDGTLIDYAYNAAPGASIVAGNAGPLNVLPEPSTYAMLGAGLGGVVVLARRRRA